MSSMGESEFPKNISGAIGINILEKDGKTIHIYYDNHGTQNYCDSNTKSLFIDQLISMLVSKGTQDKNVSIFLEELKYDKYMKIIKLWSGVKHIERMREFYNKVKKVDYVHPLDIRTILFTHSFELIRQLVMHKMSVDPNLRYTLSHFLSTGQYYYNLRLLFGLIEKNDSPQYKINNYQIGILMRDMFNNFQKIKDNKFKENFSYHFLALQKYVREFINKYVKGKEEMPSLDFFSYNIKSDNLSNPILSPGDISHRLGFPFKGLSDNIDKIGFMRSMDYINNAVMEMYSVLDILANLNKLNLVYTGYIHSSQISELLTNIYGFKNLYSDGQTNKNYDNLWNNSSMHKSCVKFPDSSSISSISSDDLPRMKYNDPLSSSDYFPNEVSKSKSYDKNIITKLDLINISDYLDKEELIKKDY